MNNPELAAVYAKAADLIRTNGHYQGDYVPDPFDREIDVPHTLRPMSTVAAVWCAVSGDPHKASVLADRAIAALALRIDGGPEWGDIFSLEDHVTSWSDTNGRTDDEVVALLETAAADCVQTVNAVPPEETVPEADREEFELARVDQQAHSKFGADESRWSDDQRAEYFKALATVHADYPDHHARKELAA